VAERRRPPGSLRWLDEGLAILSEHGGEGLTVERLCHRLGRTKGSFYHHFADIDGYQTALLAHWRAQHTRALIEAADQAPSARERRVALDHLVGRLDPRIELAVRAWASADRRVAEIAAQVDRERVDYLAKIHRQEGFEPATAEELAALEYSAYVGFDLVFPSGPKALRRRVTARWNHLLDLAAGRRPARSAPAAVTPASRRPRR
jgi:AcrR family transcriptional regulator